MKRIAFILFCGLFLGFFAMAQISGFVQRGKAVPGLDVAEAAISHPSLPINSKVRVINNWNGKEIEVTVVGRIASSTSRIAVLSLAAWMMLELTPDTDISISANPLPPPSSFTDPLLLAHDAIPDKIDKPGKKEPENTIAVAEDEGHDVQQPLKIAANTDVPAPAAETGPPQAARRDFPPPEKGPEITIVERPPPPSQQAPSYLYDAKFPADERKALQAREAALLSALPPPVPAYRMEKMEIIPGLPDPESCKYYCLQVGAYSSRQSAAKMTEQIEALGFNVATEEVNNMFRVMAMNIPAAMVSHAARKLGFAGIKQIWIRE